MAIPALSMVSAAALAAALSPTVASGFAIPLLLIGDVIALAKFRQHAQWGLIVRLIPGMLVGFVIVALIFRYVPGFAIARLVGVLIMISLVLEANRQRLLLVASRNGSEESAQPEGAVSRRLTAGLFGVLAGTTTMAANAGGAAITVYLIKLRVPMLAFMGTSTWFFLHSQPYEGSVSCRTRPHLVGLIAGKPLVRASTGPGHTGWGIRFSETQSAMVHRHRPIAELPGRLLVTDPWLKG
jgi:uncharacterized membrane protein YfcA